MTNRVLINASAAKLGGAKSILEGFMHWIGEHDAETRFMLLAPSRPEALPDNVEYRRCATDGLGTWLFSCFGIIWFSLIFRAKTCVSFNNINMLLPVCKRVTYFHQAKVFTERSLRFRLIAFAISVLRGSRFVVQSPLIAAQFSARFGHSYDILIKWPGIQTPDAIPEELPLHIPDAERVLLWPVTDPNVVQKNLSWMRENHSWFVDNDIQVLVTSARDCGLENFTSIGLLPKPQLYALYKQVKGVIIVSTEETLCLPIFEAASVGTKVWVLRRPYIESIQQWRSLPPGVTVFDNTDDLVLDTDSDAKADASSEYFKPDWLIY